MTAKEILETMPYWIKHNTRCYGKDDVLKAMEQYRNEGLREFAREMQNIGVMDDRLPSNEYVFIWLDSIKEE
jgi:hypothetical protein